MGLFEEDVIWVMLREDIADRRFSF